MVPSTEHRYANWELRLPFFMFVPQSECLVLPNHRRARPALGVEMRSVRRHTHLDTHGDTLFN